MQLNILLVEDEAGIRDGLASFLRLKGMRVTTASSLRQGLQAMARDVHDVIVTDWRLGDGLGADIVAASKAPVVIASGVPEEVDVVFEEREICVVHKPVVPGDLVERIEELARLGPRAETDLTVHFELTGGTGRADCVWQGATLPADARDRIELLLALAGDPRPAQVVDDGTFVNLEVGLTSEQEDRVSAWMPVLEKVCGDIRVVGARTPNLRARFYRDSRQDDATRVVSPSDAWPLEDESLAIDFDREWCSPERFRDLVRQARESEQNGRSVAFLNVPGHLRLYLEILGNPHDMPKRGRAGPRLPEVLAELWR